MSMSPATQCPPLIHDLLSRRFSPCAFEPRPVDQHHLLALFEAARWSASAGNEQPWSYIVATRSESDEFARMLDCVGRINLSWARLAAVLMIGCVRLSLQRGGLYPTAEHDLGLASASLVFEATARGLGVHQMTVIDREKIRDVYHVPTGISVMTMLAIGYPEANPSATKTVTSDLRTPRFRKPLSSFVFSGAWSNAWLPAQATPHLEQANARLTPHSSCSR